MADIAPKWLTYPSPGKITNDKNIGKLSTDEITIRRQKDTRHYQQEPDRILREFVTKIAGENVTMSLIADYCPARNKTLRSIPALPETRQMITNTFAENVKLNLLATGHQFFNISTAALITNLILLKNGSNCYHYQDSNNVAKENSSESSLSKRFSRSRLRESFCVKAGNRSAADQSSPSQAVRRNQGKC
ncbi:hypothetical protein KQX54_012981 [Cotesia glomerata]|uniref:Uncharacterized protein n=1 Tax=Cotesia glomerata TaxID=32391 RepID=A0AAV7J885_COTGL|nr:hypothetical protein KQX54_012981 [Cotesia glomerata]